jgi:hypothetical protein
MHPEQQHALLAIASAGLVSVPHTLGGEPTWPDSTAWQLTQQSPVPHVWVP